VDDDLECPHGIYVARGLRYTSMMCKYDCMYMHVSYSIHFYVCMHVEM
jgi:hypothetical protein